MRFVPSANRLLSLIVGRFVLIPDRPLSMLDRVDNGKYSVAYRAHCIPVSRMLLTSIVRPLLLAMEVMRARFYLIVTANLRLRVYFRFHARTTCSGSVRTLRHFSLLALDYQEFRRASVWLRAQLADLSEPRLMYIKYELTRHHCGVKLWPLSMCV